MAASQVRFLQLTGRKHDISRELQHLSMEKMDLTRDMQKVTRDYQSALSAKTIKWSSNAGVTYTDLSYNTLMKPNAANMKSPIMVSDSSGKIVLNKQYQKYAQMLDEAGGKWEGDIRNQILSELVGVPKSTLDNLDTATDAMYSAVNKYETARNDYNKWAENETKPGGAGTEYLTVDKLAKYLGSVNGVDLTKNGSYHFSSAEDLKVLAEGIKNNMSKYFVDDDKYLKTNDKTAFEAGCQAFLDYYSPLIIDTSSNADSLREASGLKGNYGNWTLDISKAFETIMGGYIIDGSYEYNDKTDEKTYPVRHTDSTAWQNWYEGLGERKTTCDTYKSEYDSSVNTANQLMTADQETMLKYYDLLFQSIADNGWTYDAQIEDSEYLSQMFQNNSYMITTIDENPCYDDSIPPSMRNYKYSYDTNIASNFDNIYMVNDTDARNEALVDYEYKKGVINAKESRIDTRMKNLETEQSAISKMLESIDQVKNDNIERTFGIWG